MFDPMHFFHVICSANNICKELSSWYDETANAVHIRRCSSKSTFYAATRHDRGCNIAFVNQCIKCYFPQTMKKPPWVMIYLFIHLVIWLCKYKLSLNWARGLTVIRSLIQWSDAYEAGCYILIKVPLLTIHIIFQFNNGKGTFKWLNSFAYITIYSDNGTINWPLHPANPYKSPQTFHPQV